MSADEKQKHAHQRGTVESNEHRATVSASVARTPPAAREHLSKEPRKPAAGRGFPTRGDLEWYCLLCGVRISISPDGQREYGHVRRPYSQTVGCPILYPERRENGGSA